MSASKTAILTGGSSGIGKALLPHLRQQGYRVCLVARGETGLKSLCESDPNLHWVACDLANPKDRAGLIERALSVLNATRLDLLVNNAGVGTVGAISETPLSEFERSWQVNTLSAIDLTQQALPFLLGPDPILAFVSSGVALRALPYEAPYCLTKAALSSFVDSLRVELSGKVTVLNFSPGPVATEFHRSQRHFGTPVAGPMRPGKAAAEIATVFARALETKKTRVFLGRNARIIHRLNFFSPALVDFLFARLFKTHKAANSPHLTGGSQGPLLEG